MRHKSVLGVLFLTVALDLVGFGVIIPLMPLYAVRFGASGQQIAVLFGAYSLMQLLFAPVWGRVSDKIGRRPVLLCSIVGNVAALVLFACAQSYGWLLAARLVSGVCTANIAVAQAAVADLTSGEHRAKGMGIVGAAFGVGFVVGPFMGGELSRWGYAAPGWFAAGLGVVNAVWAYKYLPETLPPEKRGVHTSGVWSARLHAWRSNQGIQGLLLLVFMHVCAFSMQEMCFVLFAQKRLHFDTVSSGRVFAYIGIVLACVQGGLIGRLVARWGEKRLVLLGMLAVALGMVLLPLTPLDAVVFMLVCVTLTAVGQALLSPSLHGLLSRRSLAEQQGVVMGLAQSASACARVVGPQMAGFLFDHGNENTPLWVGGVLMACVCAVAVWAFRARTLV
jgi:DHA1 family tetracycline resistance protein-like MFS transporter